MIMIAESRRHLVTMTLSPRYNARLKLDPAALDSKPSLSKLQRIQGARLAQIPFENATQHWAVGGPAVLNLTATAAKILDRKRVGCCELNGLLAECLKEEGYGVTRVLAFVHSHQGFREVASHVILVVCCLLDTADVTMHYVDVGLGNHPYIRCYMMKNISEPNSKLRRACEARYHNQKPTIARILLYLSGAGWVNGYRVSLPLSKTVLAFIFIKSCINSNETCPLQSTAPRAFQSFSNSEARHSALSIE
jgi:arylamine N-acetyltransferase